MHVNCPHCQNGVEVVEEASLTDIDCLSCGSHFSILGEDPYATLDGTNATLAGVAKTIGRFQLVNEVGVGAFGSVWRGRDPQLDRTVAIKIPRKGQLNKEESEQFFREARAAAQLKHPNIVPVHEIGRDGETIYIVSDFVQGVSLADRLTSGPMSMRESAQLCVKISQALHHAHENGVIHRDLKPSNVMLDDQGEPHVMDFGLAKRETGEITMTMEGRVLGTPAYMSPEQAEGQAHQVDRRTDVYSLGVILFELMTGELPFRGNLRMLLHQVIHDEPPNPGKLNSNVPRDLETICLKCLRKEPGRRYDDAGEFADDLNRYLSGQPIQARPVSRLEKGLLWCRRHPGIVGTTAVAVIVLATVVGIAYWQNRSTKATELVGGLLNADTTRVASIIDELKNYQSYAKDDLVSAYIESHDDSNAKLYAAMAMLPNDDSVMDYLEQRLLTVEPEQFLMVRDAVQPHAGPLVAGYWQLIEDESTDDERQFAAACALAGFDPQNEKWQDEAFANQLAAQLVGVLPSDVVPWCNALDGVAKWLADCLLTNYVSCDDGRVRERIAQIAARFYDEDLARLTDFAGVLKPEDFKLISKKVAANGPGVAEIIHQRLSPKPFEPSPAPDVTADCRNTLIKAHGALTGAYAFCQTLELSLFPDVTAELEKFGYRPIRIRPLQAESPSRLAAIWHRDDRQFRYEFELSSSDVKALGNAYVKDGLIPEDVAAYPTVDDEEEPVKFVATWVKTAKPGQERYFAAPLPATPQQFLQATFNSQKLKPIRVQALSLNNQQVLHSWVIERYDDKTGNRNVGFLNNDQSSVEQSVFSPIRHLDITSYDNPNWGEPKIITVVEDDTSISEKVIFDLQPSEMTEKAAELWQQGYVPTAIDCRRDIQNERLSTIVFTRTMPSLDGSLEESRKRANLLAVLCQLGDVNPAVKSFDQTIDPTQRTYLISRLTPNQLPLDELCSRIKSEQDPNLLQGLLLVLGNYASGSGDTVVLEEDFVSWLSASYRNHQDSGVHSALAWSLRQWKGRQFVRELDAELFKSNGKSNGATPGTRNWFVNSQGQTMVVLPEVSSFLMGSPWSEPGAGFDERLHRRSVNRSFAISATEVTREQFLQFPEFEEHDFDPAWSHDGECPIGRVRWFQAAKYCNLLSAADGIEKDQWCYPDDVSDGMKPFPDYLERRGYRLPSEAEWEYAARSGAITAFCFGQQSDVLDKYGWYLNNSGSPVSGHPVASLRPNLFGLFDMHGNAYEWCSSPLAPDKIAPYKISWTETVTDVPDTRSMKRDDFRSIRGGSAGNESTRLRCGSRSAGPANSAGSASGFRVVKTMD